MGDALVAEPLDHLVADGQRAPRPVDDDHLQLGADGPLSLAEAGPRQHLREGDQPVTQPVAERGEVAVGEVLPLDLGSHGLVLSLSNVRLEHESGRPHSFCTNVQSFPGPPD